MCEDFSYSTSLTTLDIISPLTLPFNYPNYPYQQWYIIVV